MIQFQDGYRVVSDKGTLLSHKPLSLEEAKRQLIAVSLREGWGLRPPHTPEKGGMTGTLVPVLIGGKAKKSAQPSSRFAEQLQEAGLKPSTYLARARRVAKRMNYDPKALTFADNSTHKLQITTPEGRVRRFGRVGYGDFLIWSHLEKRGDVPNGYADKKRSVFRKSHIAMSKKFGITDEYAPNNLAINILW